MTKSAIKKKNNYSPLDAKIEHEKGDGQFRKQSMKWLHNPCRDWDNLSDPACCFLHTIVADNL